MINKINQPAGNKILIVEDSPTQAEKLKFILEMKDYEVTVARDGEEALSVVQSILPTVIISDIMMPRMNGFEFCSRIKNDEQTASIPVILLTSLSNTEDVIKGLASGADNFITKPYDESYLLSHVEKIIKSKVSKHHSSKTIDVKVLLSGEMRNIGVDPQQMFSLLLSTYEAAVQRNHELFQTQEELKVLNEQLEEIVEERTAELEQENAIRKQAELQIIKMNRVYAVLSNVNQTIVRVRDKQKLFDDICRIAHEDGQFKMAWIGLVDKQQFHAVASAGPAVEYSKTVHIDLKDKITGNDPIAKTIKTGTHYLTNDIPNDLIKNPWLENVLQLGCCSSASFPIKVFDETIGAFIFYSEEKDFFDEGEVRLLDEMAMDISFALEYIEKESVRKKNEELLRQSELKYKALFDDDLTGDYITKVDGTFLLCNAALANIFGFNSVEEVINKNIKTFYKDSNDQQFLLNMIRKDGKVEEFEREFILKDGRQISVIQNLVGEFDNSGELVRIKGYLFDNTKRKQAEDELIIAKERAEESDRLKSAFLANMSHEIRTPMNGILGFTELLKEPFLSGEEQKHYISVIEKSGERMLNIINDIISISKIESGEIELIIKEMNIHKDIEDICEFFKPEIDEKNLQIDLINHIHAEDCIINTDRDKVYTVLSNLVKNAIKFTNHGEIQIGCENKGNFIQFFIKDTGIGISKAHQNIIFERFRQVSESLTRKYEGAGLGLSISKAFIEKLGGKIWVKSEEGKGSTFYFTIPYKQKMDDVKTEVNVGANTNGNQLAVCHNILIVEDDEISYEYIKTILENMNTKTFAAKTGLEAVNVCRENSNIDLVLMDIRMPQMDGYEATKQIRQFNQKVVIIAQTAFALARDREKAIEAGCNDHISKPIKKEELTQKIRRFLY